VAWAVWITKLQLHCGLSWKHRLSFKTEEAMGPAHVLARFLSRDDFRR